MPDAVQAAATAAIAAEKREKEKAKEIKLASKSSILANKKKMNNVLTMWKQRSHEGQATRVALDDNQSLASTEDKSFPVGQSMKNKLKADVAQTSRESTSFNLGAASNAALESQVKPRPVSNSSGGTLMGVIRGSGRGIVKSDSLYSASSSVVSSSTTIDGGFNSTLSLTADTSTPSTTSSFRTDASALGSYTPPVTSASGKRRFSEMPQSSASASREQPQTTYRDRAAERRSLYGSSTFIGDDRSNLEFGDLSKSFLLAFVLDATLSF